LNLICYSPIFATPTEKSFPAYDSYTVCTVYMLASYSNSVDSTDYGS